jgi:hypothetical protein
VHRVTAAASRQLHVCAGGFMLHHACAHIHPNAQVPVFLGPVWPTRRFCSWAFSPTPWRWQWANKLSYSFLISTLWLQERARINGWRKASLGLPPLRGGVMPVVEAAGGDVPVVLMCSADLTPGRARPDDYPDYVQVWVAGLRVGCVCVAQPTVAVGSGSGRVAALLTQPAPHAPLTRPHQYTGFAFVPDAKEGDVDPELRRFVAAGEPPVYLGFGSMPAPDPKKLVQMAAEVRAPPGTPPAPRLLCL